VEEHRGLGLFASVQVLLPNEEQREAILRVTLQRHAVENEIDEELLSNDPDSAGERPLQVLVEPHLRVL
jgi:ATP-dependent 26S proteasome regulatory subunit